MDVATLRWSADSDGVHLVTAGDGRVAWGVAGVVGSALAVLPVGRPARVTVLDGGIPAGMKERLRAAARRRGDDFQLEFRPFEWPEVRTAPALEGSWMTYARLAIPRLVGSTYCLYVDADTVLLADPAPLIAEAAAAPDVSLWAGRNYPNGSYRQQLARQSPELVEGIGEEEPYFNGGVQVINVQAWRAAGVAERALALAVRHRFIAHDQDALNVCFRGAWRELPERWNYQLYDRRTWPAGAALLHYSGRSKPWHCGYPAAAAAPYRAALATAGWPRWRARPDLTEWLRNSGLRPWLAQWQFRLRRLAGLDGIKRR